MFVAAIKRRYVCLSSSTIFLLGTYLYVYAMKALLEVIRGGAPQDVCVCAREVKRKYGYVSVIFTL